MRKTLSSVTADEARSLLGLLVRNPSRMLNPQPKFDLILHQQHTLRRNSLKPKIGATLEPRFRQVTAVKSVI